MMMLLSLKDSSLSEFTSAVAFSSTCMQSHPVYMAAQKKRGKKVAAVIC